METLFRAGMEHLEAPEENRYAVFPIQRMDAWLAYKKAQSLFWVDEEIEGNLKQDANDWPTLAPEVQNFIKHILAFFAVSDGVVTETLTEVIMGRVQPREVKMWYNFQAMIEDVHNIVYSKLVDTYISSPQEKQKLFSALDHFPVIRKKINWVKKWLGGVSPLQNLSDEEREKLLSLEKFYYLSLKITGAEEDPGFRELFETLNTPKPPLALPILINSIMEGVFFSGSFCAIYWIARTYRKLPGLAKANEFISRDEGMHQEFGICLYKKCREKLPEDQVHLIIAEAVEIETEFICEALPRGLLGMNSSLMTQYVQFVADEHLQSLGYSRYFQVENPFEFMKSKDTGVRITDFFTDPNVTEYGQPLAQTSASDQELSLEENF